MTDFETKHNGIETLHHGVDILHHGAVSGVTGSCHQYLADNDNILIDCGLFQGKEQGSEADVNLAEFPFDVASITALIVTHGHIDHVGRIPWLIADGYSGPIYCSIPTAKLLPIILRDALGIHIKGNQRLVETTIERIKNQIVGVALNEWHPLKDVKVRLQNAGHILGSVYVEVDSRLNNLGNDGCSDRAANHRTVFSGDLGSPGAVFVDAVVSPERADTLVIETTYGNKNHSSREHREVFLAKLVNKALEDNGTLLIPAFSLGRTQELLSMLENLLHTGKIISDKNDSNSNHTLPVILDSPLAQELTSTYRSLSDHWPQKLLDRKKASRLPLAFNQLITVENHREHLKLVKRLAQTEQAAIVIAASGMCQGGRIVNYLEALLPLKTTDVLFVGYQARGTYGAEIQQQAKANMLTPKKNQAAQVHTMSGFSAHADQTDLLSFIKGIATKPNEIRLVHGDEDAKKEFKSLLESNQFQGVVIPI